MTQRPRTIQIFLPSGDPAGIQVAALTTNIVQVIEVPRSLIHEFLKMPQAQQVGVYYLIGEEPTSGNPAVYIGQTGTVGKRLNEHHLEGKHDFWSRALVAISLTHSWTTTHALFLEWRSIAQANAAQRFYVYNGNAGSKPHTPAPLEADCEEFFETIRTLVATLGQRFMESVVVHKPGVSAAPSAAAPQSELLFCSGTDGAEATGQYTDTGMVVLKGAKFRLNSVPSFAGSSAYKRRQSMLSNGDLEEQGNHLLLQRDVEFPTPSAASDAVLGRSSNGWQEWHDAQGVSLDTLRRQTG